MRPLMFYLLLLAPLASTAQQSGADAAASPSQTAPVQTEFHVKYVSGTNVYIDAGRDAGLAEGTKIVLKQAPAKADDNDAAVQPGVIAKLTVISVASTSAVCQVDETTRDLAVGDVLSLPETELEQMVAKNAISNTRVYPMVVSFSEGD